MPGRRLVTTVMLGLVAALITTLLSPATPAAAAVRAPTGLTPDGTSTSTNPVLSWNPVKGATSYRVELSQSASFDSLVWQTTTVNRQATPTTVLPTGQLHWRVRAADATGTLGPWSTAGFRLNPKAPPAQISPSEGDDLPQPQEPPQLVWAPVNGAISYELAVGTDPNLTTATTHTTRTTSFAFGAPQAEGTWYWQVRAVLGSGQATSWSAIRSYDVQPLTQPSLVTPDNSADTVVQDVALGWTAVPGASRYEVRVGTDENFNTVVATAISVAARWSPPVTLDNDQYWWQVRAYDSQNQTAEWSDPDVQTWQFERRWQFGGTTVLDPDVPELVHPADAVTPATHDPFFFEWQPVRLASSYRLQMGTDRNFSPNTFWECSTKQTTYTPTVGLRSGCMPHSAGSYYWRVRGVDDPRGVVTPWSDIREFTYRPGSTELKAPADGETGVAVPTMSWRHSSGAERYRLTYFVGAVQRTVDTYSTSHTPTTVIPSGTVVRWTVQAIYANNDTAAYPLGGEQTFTVGAAPAGTATLPDPVSADTAGDRFPALRWKPVTGAAYYKLYVGNAGSGSYETLAGTYAYPAGTDATKNYLQSRSSDWRVGAFKADNTPISVGAPGTYVVHDLGSVSGQGVARTGTALDGPLRCDLTLHGEPPNEPDVCSMRQTPVLDWEPVTGASSYLVYLSRDERLTNPVPGYPVTTHRTRWTPTAHLPDSQAGQAYHWVIRPCTTAGVCAPDPVRATHAFEKTSHPVRVLSPADGATVADAVTFSWEDYLLTNRDATVADGDPVLPAAARSTVEAQQYRVEVSTSQTFQTLLESVVVDQTSYTSPARMYPEGRLFWRVTALDGSSNAVGSTGVREFTKASDPVQLLFPANDATSPRSPALRWRTQPFGSSYVLEVYKNNDTRFSPVNRVVSISSRLAAYSLTSPLPASQLPYVWRVRRIDVSGNLGPWSDARTFRVRGNPPPLVAPAAETFVSATSALFTWQGVQGATSYRYERRAADAVSSSETVTTAGLAWAPTARLADGRWEWRVSSLDAVGSAVATSRWRPFTVDGTAPTVVARTPLTTAKPTANVTATFSEAVRRVDTGVMRLFVKGGQHPLSATVTLSADKRKAVLNPAKNLPRGRTYRAVLTNAITDRAGNPLPTTAWTFTVPR